MEAIDCVVSFAALITSMTSITPSMRRRKRNRRSENLDLDRPFSGFGARSGVVILVGSSSGPRPRRLLHNLPLCPPLPLFYPSQASILHLTKQENNTSRKKHKLAADATGDRPIGSGVSHSAHSTHHDSHAFHFRNPHAKRHHFPLAAHGAWKETEAS